MERGGERKEEYEVNLFWIKANDLKELVGLRGPWQPGRHRGRLHFFFRVATRLSKQQVWAGFGNWQGLFR